MQTDWDSALRHLSLKSVCLGWYSCYIFTFLLSATVFLPYFSNVIDVVIQAGYYIISPCFSNKENRFDHTVTYSLFSLRFSWEVRVPGPSATAWEQMITVASDILNHRFSSFYSIFHKNLLSSTDPHHYLTFCPVKEPSFRHQVTVAAEHQYISRIQ